MRARALVLVGVLLLVPALSGCAQLMDAWGELQNSRSAPGDNAVDLLSNEKYSKLVVEVDYVPGSGPSAEAEQMLLETLATYTAKSREDITLRKSADLPARGEDYKYSMEEVRALEKEYREHYARGDAIALHVLWLDGGSDADRDQSRVLGAAYHGTSIVMFKGNIKASTGGGLLSNGCSMERIEPIITKHELGHVFGLVNHGLPMTYDREDPDHEGHSKFKDSIMYYAVERSSFLGVYNDCSSVPTEFDQYDEADMRAARGE